MTMLLGYSVQLCPWSVITSDSHYGQFFWGTNASILRMHDYSDIVFMMSVLFLKPGIFKLGLFHEYPN